MAFGSKKSGCSGLAFVALLVALLALWVGWSAYRRTGGTFDTLVKSPLAGSETTVSELPAEAEAVPETPEDWRAALETAREELLRRRDDVANDRDLAAVQRDLTEIRQNLERAWQTAGDKAGKARDTWRELDGDLERLQGQVREKSHKAQETLDALAKKMESAG